MERHTEQQLADFRRRYSAKKRNRVIVAFLVPTALVLSFIAPKSIQPWAGAIGFLAVMGSFVFMLFNWRCPACNASFLSADDSINLVDRCENCGVELV